MAPKKGKIGEVPAKTYAPSDFHASSSKLIDDDTGLCSKNQQLIGEMANFLAEIEYSPGDENSVETRKHDNYSSADLRNTHAAVKASVACRSPSMEDADDEEYRYEDGYSRLESRGDAKEDKMAGDRDGGALKEAGREVERIAASNCRSLVPIDENEAGGTAPEGEYEYFNDDSYNDLRQGADDGTSEEDSLVAMAQRMDAASVGVHSLGSTSEKLLALPSSKLTAGLKKLGRIGGGGTKKPPPPPYPRKAAPPPPPPPPRRVPHPHDSGDVRAAFQTPQDRSPSAGSPSSSHDQIDNRRRSASSANTFDDMNGLQRSLPNMGAETGETPAPHERGRRLSHSPSAAREDDQPLKGRASYDNGTTAEVMPTPASAPGEMNALDEKVSAKQKHKQKHKRSHKHKRRDRSKGRKKRSDASLEESMQGIGFNTRVHEECPLRIHDNHEQRRRKKKASAKAPKQVTEQPQASSGLYDSMQGKGFNTRIHDKLQRESENKQYGGPLPEQHAGERRAARKKANEEMKLKEKSKQSTTKSPTPDESERSGSNDGSSYDSDAHTEIFYESCTDSDESDRSFSDEEDDGSYDSDAHTEIFYESTDDEFSSSDEELEAVGTSVELAVQDLNNSRAIVKVKKIFGRR